MGKGGGLRGGITIIAAMLGAADAALPAMAGEYDNLARSRFVHCAFYRAYAVDPTTGNRVLVEGRSDSLTHLQRIGNERDRARAIYTGVAGARDVAVINTGKRLHYIDHMAGMYVVTTIDSCLEHDERRGTCLVYGATQARHFDSRVLLEPDIVYQGIKANSDPGFCDYSFIGLQQAERETP